jgi:predicted dehydrogenase
MTEKVRLGIIGVGQIGKHHLENYSKIENVEVVAIDDIDEAELHRVGDLYGIHHRYTNFPKMLERDDIQAIDVCLHNNLHMTATVAAMNAGKHVYCEKPMAGSYIDAETMYNTAQELGLKLSIQSYLLFEAETRAARYIIDRGLLGERYHARSYGFRRRGLMWTAMANLPSCRKKSLRAARSMIRVFTISSKSCTCLTTQNRCESPEKSIRKLIWTLAGGKSAAIMSKN